MTKIESLLSPLELLIDKVLVEQVSENLKIRKQLKIFRSAGLSSAFQLKKSYTQKFETI